MIFLDTSYLLAVTVKADSLHERAVAWSRSIDEPIATSAYVLCEFANHLSSPPLRALIAPVMRWAMEPANVLLVDFDAEMLSKGWTLHQNRPDKSWSLTDCFSFLTMQERGITKALT
jgi:predicted nucleic acid-binding protein